jgi:hypothetical protein
MKPSNPYPRAQFISGSPHIERCPFCGGTGRQTSNGCATLWYWVSCGRGGPKGCNASGPTRRTMRGAIKAWNRYCTRNPILNDHHT